MDATGDRTGVLDQHRESMGAMDSLYMNERQLLCGDTLHLCQNLMTPPLTTISCHVISLSLG